MREVWWYVEKQILTSCIFAAPQQHKLYAMDMLWQEHIRTDG